MSGGLALPGEGRRHGLRPSRAALAVLAGALWLPVQSTLLPAFGLGTLPLDPVLPLVAAFALGGRRAEALLLAVVLGWMGDVFTGVASGRLVLQYVLVVLLAAPMHGRVVLRDRLVPVLGIGFLSFASGALVLLGLAAVGAALATEPGELVAEAGGTALMALLGWPVYRRIAGWQDDRSALHLRGGR